MKTFSPRIQLGVAPPTPKGNASQEVLLLRGWLKFLAHAKYRLADG